uniref:(northern house mosquito) hypothetical protein n=1 Tax=Culex pipiens TaxID=7175 RepID=A0A8D8G0F1_CULPI
MSGVHNCCMNTFAVVTVAPNQPWGSKIDAILERTFRLVSGSSGPVSGMVNLSMNSSVDGNHVNPSVFTEGSRSRLIPSAQGIAKLSSSTPYRTSARLHAHFRRRKPQLTVILSSWFRRSIAESKSLVPVITSSM